MPLAFSAPIKKLTDIDLPRIASQIGCGEDELHAVLEVETSGGAADRQGRLKMLFEPHVFYRNLSGAKRDAAVAAGLAYPNWRSGYPADSYPRFLHACQIDQTAAIKAASWGLGQILGENFKAAGFASPQAMLQAFTESEAAHLEAMVQFIKANGMARALQRHDWAAFASRYNGPKYATHNYHGRLAAAFAKWQKIPDTPWDRNAAVLNVGGTAVDTRAGQVVGTVEAPAATTPVALPLPATLPTDAKDAKHAGFLAGGVGLLATGWQTIMGNGLIRAAIVFLIIAIACWLLVRPVLRRLGVLDLIYGRHVEAGGEAVPFLQKMRCAIKGAKQLLWGRFLALVAVAAPVLQFAEVIDFTAIYNMLPTIAGIVTPAMYGPAIGGLFLAWVNNTLRKANNTPAGQTDLGLMPTIAPPLVPDDVAAGAGVAADFTLPDERPVEAGGRKKSKGKRAKVRA